MNSVAVLLSTYNGEKYLRQQLDSVLGQKDVDVHLIIRDDGSQDHTIAILKEYASSHGNVCLLLESNVGCEKSFEILMKYATRSNCDFFAFCDQDDVWFPDKLAVSVSAIRDCKEPALYCCNQMITDENLHPVRLMLTDASFEKAVNQQNENYFVNRHGCTMLWNSSLQSILGSLNHNNPFVPGHDGWVNLVARCSGEVIIGKEPLMYYRIHGANTGGFENNFIKRIKKGIKLYLTHDCFRNEMAKDCLSLILDKETMGRGDVFLKRVAVYRDSFFGCIRLLFSKQIWQYGRADSFLYALSVLLGRF